MSAVDLLRFVTVVKVFDNGLAGSELLRGRLLDPVAGIETCVATCPCTIVVLMGRPRIEDSVAAFMRRIAGETPWAVSWMGVLGVGLLVCFGSLTDGILAIRTSTSSLPRFAGSPLPISSVSSRREGDMGEAELPFLLLPMSGRRRVGLAFTASRTSSITVDSQRVVSANTGVKTTYELHE